MRLSKLALTTAGGFLLPLLVVTIPWYPGQLIASLLLIAFLPGYALSVALWPNRNDSPFFSLEQWLVPVATSFGLTVGLILMMAYIRIPLNAISIAGGLGMLALLFTVSAWQRLQKKPESGGSATSNQAGNSSTTVQLFWLVVILLIAAIFRMVNVHYSDLQGDEADILMRAVPLLFGEINKILTHSKGPGEILILDAIGALTGRFDELTVRLPFALAGTVSIGLIMLLGEQLINPLAGRIAGLLAAIDGVLISYARTAQYQSVVLLLTLAAIWCYYRFQQTGGASRRLHGLGTFLLASALLFHFEVILLLPIVVYLTVAHIPWRGLRHVPAQLSQIRLLWPSAIIFVVTTTAFYIPFLLNPSLSRTGRYLENRIGGGSLPPFNNLDHFFYFEALKYNSAYFVLFFNGLLVVAAVLALAKALNQRVFQTALYLAIVAFAAVGLSLAGLDKLSALLVALGLAILFILIIFSPRTSLPQRTLWLWLAAPFWVYVFLVNRPGKHHYLFLGPLTILVAMAVAEIWQRAIERWSWLRQPLGKWTIAAVSVIVLLIFAGHTYLLILRSDLEYILTYPANKSSFYPTDSAYPYGTRIGFGYPFRLGWQVIGQLKRSGQLEGDWAGNDTGNAPDWYMLGTSPTPCYPRYVLRGEITYKGDEDFDVPFDPAEFGYSPRYRIWGNDRLRMTVLEFNPLASDSQPADLYEPARFDRPATVADFAATLSQNKTSSPQILLEPSPVLGEGSELKNNAPPEYQARAQLLDGRVALAGYDLDDRFAQPGGIVPITLYWNAQNPLSLRYKVFVHVISPEGQLLTQADDFPVCGTFQANTWPVNQTVLDRHLLRLPADAAPGDYTLVVGMYEPDLNLRLNYFDVAGNEQGNSLNIGTLTIRPK